MRRNIRKIELVLFVLVIILFILYIIPIKVLTLTSPDSQYSIITKTSLGRYLIPSFDGLYYTEGKVLIVDNRANKVIHEAESYVKVDVKWEKDKALIERNGEGIIVKLPRPIKDVEN